MEFIWMEEWQAIFYTEGDNFAGAPIQNLRKFQWNGSKRSAVSWLESIELKLNAFRRSAKV